MHFKPTRRDFLITLGSGATLAFLPRFAKAARFQSKLNFVNKPLPGDMFVIGDLPTGGNVLAIYSGDGAIVIDSKYPHTAEALVSDIETLTTAKPKVLINTHHHADHSGGNWIFTGQARIAAHRNFNPRIEANLAKYIQQAQGHVEELKTAKADQAKIDAAAALAQRIKAMKAEQFTATKNLTDFTDINHGGVNLHAHHFGNGHTDNDLVIFSPKHNVLHMGDLLFHKVHPFIDRSAKANTIGWQSSLKQAMSFCNEKTVVIPGHGELADKTAISAQIEYFDRMREIVGQAIKDGKTRDEVIAMNPEPYKDYGLQQIRPFSLGGIYDELLETK